MPPYAVQQIYHFPAKVSEIKNVHGEFIYREFEFTDYYLRAGPYGRIAQVGTNGC